jgi:hypothetical protein
VSEMSAIDEIVSVVNIFSEPEANGVNFDTLLIIGESKKVKRVASYGNLTEVLADYDIANPEYLAAKAAFAQDTRPSKVMIGQRQGGTLETYPVAYAAIQAVTDDFYGVVITSRDAALQLAFADFIESQTKIFGCASSDANTFVSDNDTNPAYKMFNKKYNRSFCIYSAKAAEEYPDAAVLGKMLSYDAGSANWANKSFTGLTPMRTTTAQISTLNGLNCNRISAIGGKSLLRTGTAASGRFLDITHGADWLTNEVQNAIFNLLSSTDKVDFSNSGGLLTIRNVLNGVFAAAVDRNFIEKEYEINIPDEKAISRSDQLAGILKGVSCKATPKPGINTISSLKIYFN